MLTTRSLGVIVGASAFFLSVNAQFGVREPLWLSARLRVV